MVDYLDWDSSFFGLRIAKATVSSQKDFDELKDNINALKEKYDLIYIFAKGDLVKQSSNVILVDRKVVYTTKISGPYSFDTHIIEYDKSFVSEDLRNLALGSGVYSRFKKDSNFPTNAYERLYTRWIEQSVNHQIATEVFCFMIEGSPKGLLTINRKDTTCNIGLVATSPSCQGQGIGYMMLVHAKHFVYLKGYNNLNVVTQFDNKVACHLYEKAGFTVKSSTDIFHWWLNK